MRILPDSSLPPAIAETAKQQSILNNHAQYAVHDTLRTGFYSVAAQSQPLHPMDASLRNWDQTQLDFKLQMQRRINGLASPFCREMDRTMLTNVSKMKNPALMGGLRGSNLALDILNDNNNTVDWEDVLGHHGDLEAHIDPHIAMEHARGLGSI